MRALLLPLLLLPLAAAAEIYKWTDENGKLHFGERPPANAGAQGVQVKPSPAAPAGDPGSADRLRQLQRFSEVYEQEQTEKREAAAKQKEEQAKRKVNCEKARHNLEQLRTASNVLQGYGAAQRSLSFEERAAAERDAQKQVDQWCKP